MNKQVAVRQGVGLGSCVSPLDVLLLSREEISAFLSHLPFLYRASSLFFSLQRAL